MKKFLSIIAICQILIACNPTVRLENQKPIEINLNINIEHKVKLKIDKELENTFENSEDIF